MTVVFQLVESDGLEDFVLITSGNDLHVRLWNLVGTHLGTLLHGPRVVRAQACTSTAAACVCAHRRFRADFSPAHS